MDILRDIIASAHRAGSGRSAAADATTLSVRDHWEWALIDVGIVLLFVVVPHALLGDGRVRFGTLTNLLEHGTLANTPYSVVGPLFSTPLYYLGKLALGPEWWCARFNTFLLAGALVATASLLRRYVDGRLLRTFLLLLVAASMFPNHVRGYFGEVFTALLVLVGIAALSSGREGLGWTAMILGVANTPATIVGLLFVAIKHVRNTRRVRHLMPVLVTASLILLESWIRRGNPFSTGYENNAGFRTLMPYSGQPGFSYPFFFGLLSITLSFGKGILFFAPGLLLMIGKDDREVPSQLRTLWAYSIWFLAGLIVVYAKWWAWYGGWFWGPRFFLMASIPASLSIAIKLRQLSTLSTQALGVLFAVLTLSVWVGVNGAVFNQANLDICEQKRYALEFLCWYAPEFSVLWHPFIAPVPLTFDRVLFIAYCGLVYVWLAVPLVKTLIMRASDSVAARRLNLRTWRF
jgi:hypothetical protein